MVETEREREEEIVSEQAVVETKRGRGRDSVRTTVVETERGRDSVRTYCARDKERDRER